jgi:hypothetical protein
MSDLHWQYMCADCGHVFHVPGPSLRGLDLPNCIMCDGPTAGIGASEWSGDEDDDEEEK